MNCDDIVHLRHVNCTDKSSTVEPLCKDTFDLDTAYIVPDIDRVVHKTAPAWNEVYTLIL